MNRARADEKILKVEQIFESFPAIKGHILFNADNEQKARKDRREKIQRAYKKTCVRFNALLALNLISGELYIKMLLRRIEWHKKALIVNIDGNQPVFLERDLS